MHRQSVIQVISFFLSDFLVICGFRGIWPFHPSCLNLLAQRYLNILLLSFECLWDLSQVLAFITVTGHLCVFSFSNWSG